MNLDQQIAEILSFFAHEHLSPHLAKVSRPFADLAQTLAVAYRGDEIHEVLAALRKLLEAKDAAVRCEVLSAKWRRAPRPWEPFIIDGHDIFLTIQSSDEWAKYIQHAYKRYIGSSARSSITEECNVINSFLNFKLVQRRATPTTNRFGSGPGYTGELLESWAVSQKMKLRELAIVALAVMPDS